MKYLYVGIDISKDSFDMCILDSLHQTVSKHSVFNNDKQGITKFIEFLNSFEKDSMWICMEHTGHYGALLSALLEGAFIKYSIVNPLEIKRSSGLTRGKTDAVDAYRIASYAVKNHYKLTPNKLTSENIQKLKVKLTQRELFVKVMVQYKNNLKSLVLIGQTTNLKEDEIQLKRMIRSQEGQLIKLEKSILDLINQDEKLKKTYDKITSVIGVGFVTAAICITETENFTRFTDARKFCCHAGLAPFAYESGSSVKGRTKTSYLRNKRLKTILFTAANTAAVHDLQLKAYKKRKIKEGKHKLSVVNALANKVVARIFAVAKRDEPFVRLSA